MSVIKNVKAFTKRYSKAFIISAMSALVMCLSVVTSFAAETNVQSANASENMISQFSTSLQTVQNDVVSLISQAIPVALMIFGMVIAVNKGISVVKGMIGKS